MFSVVVGHRFGNIAGDVAPGATKGAAAGVEKQILGIFGDALDTFKEHVCFGAQLAT